MFSQWFEMHLNVFYAEYLMHRKTPNSKNLTLLFNQRTSVSSCSRLSTCLPGKLVAYNLTKW